MRIGNVISAFPVEMIEMAGSLDEESPNHGNNAFFMGNIYKKRRSNEGEGYSLLCLSGPELAPTGQRPLLKDSWRQNSILWEEQLADPTIAYITSVKHPTSSNQLQHPFNGRNIQHRVECICWFFENWLHGSNY